MFISLKRPKHGLLLLRLFLLSVGLIAASYPTDKAETKADAFGSAGGQVSSTHFETAFIVGQSSPSDISESSNYRNISGFFASFSTFGAPQKAEARMRVPVPEEYALDQNYPNPFNPETTIEYQLPEAGKVMLKIYNVIGQEIRTLVNEDKEAGYHKIRWDGMDNKGVKVSSGIYIYQLQVGNFLRIKKMLSVM